jgi:hypothetical protein
MSFFQTIVRSFSTDEGTRDDVDSTKEEKGDALNSVDDRNRKKSDIPGQCGTPTKVREDIWCMKR